MTSTPSIVYVQMTKPSEPRAAAPPVPGEPSPSPKPKPRPSPVIARLQFASPDLASLFFKLNTAANTVADAEAVYHYAYSKWKNTRASLKPTEWGRILNSKACGEILVRLVRLEDNIQLWVGVVGVDVAGKPVTPVQQIEQPHRLPAGKRRPPALDPIIEVETKTLIISVVRPMVLPITHKIRGTHTESTVAGLRLVVSIDKELFQSKVIDIRTKNDAVGSQPVLEFTAAPDLVGVPVWPPQLDIPAEEKGGLPKQVPPGVDFDISALPPAGEMGGLEIMQAPPADLAAGDFDIGTLPSAEFLGGLEVMQAPPVVDIDTGGLPPAGEMGVTDLGTETRANLKRRDSVTALQLETSSPSKQDPAPEEPTWLVHKRVRLTPPTPDTDTSSFVSLDDDLEDELPDYEITT